MIAPTPAVATPRRWTFRSSAQWHFWNAQRPTRRPARSWPWSSTLTIPSLSTWPEISAADFGFVSKEWQTWAESASAPVIPGTLRLFKRAQELSVAVFFITGRADTLRDATERNLHSAGYDKWDGLALRT